MQHQRPCGFYMVVYDIVISSNRNNISEVIVTIATSATTYNTYLKKSIGTDIYLFALGKPLIVDLWRLEISDLHS